jgi:hypothetical protein
VKLKAVNYQLKRRMRQPIPEQGRWLASVVRGHMAYYAVPRNYEAVAAFCDQVTRYWLKVLRRPSQKTRVDWTRMVRIRRRWLPSPAGGSPVKVSTEAPGSRPRFVERWRAERGVKSLFGGSKPRGP